MTKMKAKSFLPFEVVFNPNWWHRTAGVSFERPFYFDGVTRVTNDVTMRRVLHRALRRHRPGRG